MLKIHRINKIISFVIILCMIIQLADIGGMQVSAEELPGPTTMEYYVGGEGALDTNDGISSNTPFATLAQAAKAINNSGAGNYEIILQGNTSEAEQSIIGNGNDVINITLICRTQQSVASVSGSAVSGSAITSGEASVSGSAIIARNTGYTGTLISISGKATLTLGESSGNSGLTINGMGDKVTGCSRLIDIGSYATLNMYQNVVLCNNNVSGINGGAINVNADGIFAMYGGSITGISNGASGAVYNRGTFHLKDGTISLNKGSSYGGGIMNDGTLIMDGGSITVVIPLIIMAEEFIYIMGQQS